MKRLYCRYTPSQLRVLGYSDDVESDSFVSYDVDKAIVERDAIVKGQFKNIIDVIFSSNDGSLDNDINSLVSENAPESVKSFVRNVLMCDVQAVQSAPDDDAAFEALIPRSVQSMGEIAPYVDFLRNTVADVYNRAQQQQQSSSSNNGSNSVSS